LREQWVVVAAHRQDRPWEGHRAEILPTSEAPYDETCTFCPGNVRVSGVANPAYEATYAFDNDRPCVGGAAPPASEATEPLRAASARGTARVICFDPRHDLSLRSLGVSGVTRVLETFREEERRCAADPVIEHVLIFENRGEVVGVSNPHPHGQLYGTDFVMGAAARHVRVAADHHRQTGRSLLQDVVQRELEEGERVVAVHGDVVVLVPHFARWAYEVLVVPRMPIPGIKDASDGLLADLAGGLHDILCRYDGLWSQPFPYVMTFHNAPLRAPAPGFHFHIELQPPLRKPHLMKHLAGPELGGDVFLADTAPESTAEELRGVGS